jgi:hypothetical protein
LLSVTGGIPPRRWRDRHRDSQGASWMSALASSSCRRPERCTVAHQCVLPGWRQCAAQRLLSRGEKIGIDIVYNGVAPGCRRPLSFRVVKHGGSQAEFGRTPSSPRWRSTNFECWPKPGAAAQNFRSAERRSIAASCCARC